MYKNLDPQSLGFSGTQNELIELTLSYGFKGFNLDLVDFERQVEQKGLAHARRLIDSAPLKLGSFVLPVNVEGDDAEFQRDLEKLPDLLTLASALDCDRCRVTIASASDHRPYHETFELYRRRLGEIGKVLEAGELRLGVGFIAPLHYRQRGVFPGICSFDALLLLVKSVGSSNVGVALDTWHWHVAGGTMEQIGALTAADVVTVDLADATSPAGVDDVDESARKLPGTVEDPSNQNVAVLSALGACGYDGPVTPVPHASCFEGQRRDEIVKAASAAVDAVWQAAGLNKRGRPAGGAAAAAGQP